MKFKILTPVFLMIFFSVTAVQGPKVIQVNSKQVKQMLRKDPGIIVLDVRTSNEFNEGHIKGARNIDILQADAFSKIDKLDRNAKYVVHCRTNHRSSMAVDYMVKNGFRNIYQMMDGSNGWYENKLPIVK